VKIVIKGGIMPIPKFTGKYCKNNCFYLTSLNTCALYPTGINGTLKRVKKGKRLREHACVIKYGLIGRRIKPKTFKSIIIKETTTSEITKRWIVKYKWRQAGIGSIYYCRSNQRYCFIPITIGNNLINSNILRELADFLDAADKGLKIKKGDKDGYN